MDVLEAFPQLGRFPLAVPILEGGATVEFAIRGDDGVYADVGSYDLALEDEVGLSEVVVGTETLVDNGPSDNRLDIVLVGDGYTAEELDQWRLDASELSEGLLAAEPFSSYAAGINVHRVDAVSNESGASFDCSGDPDECGIRDTAFGSIFAVELVNILLGTDYDARSVLQEHQWEVARAVSHVPWDLVVVVVNTDRRSGMVVHYATVSATDELVSVGIHEYLHLQGLLGDACIRSDALGLPVNVSEDPVDVPWAACVGFEDVGAWEGAYNCDDLYRPAESCTMRGTSIKGFCPVCTERLVTTQFRFMDIVDSVELVAGAGGLEAHVEGPFEVEAVVDDRGDSRGPAGQRRAAGTGRRALPLGERGLREGKARQAGYGAATLKETPC
ncbi:MAG: hypothetical protein GY913_20385 [Proteobacteria bacterium]|nr:hypothetical protein [Pseudomonadota bacterium]MCP4919266.1 hypothetical protein [Pseudomonadota bacterium]